nr:hypothetical protein [Tanacetum cinerariifolium]
MPSPSSNSPMHPRNHDSSQSGAFQNSAREPQYPLGFHVRQTEIVRDSLYKPLTFHASPPPHHKKMKSGGSVGWSGGGGGQVAAAEVVAVGDRRITLILVLVMPKRMQIPVGGALILVWEEHGVVFVDVLSISILFIPLQWKTSKYLFISPHFLHINHKRSSPVNILRICSILCTCPLKSQSLVTRASAEEEEVAYQVLEEIMSELHKSPSSIKELCTNHISELCKKRNLRAAAMLLQLLRDKHSVNSLQAYNLLLVAAAETNDTEISSRVFKDMLVNHLQMNSTTYFNVAKAISMSNDFTLVQSFLKEISELIDTGSLTVINRIIYAFAECGHDYNSMLVFDNMKRLNFVPDLVTFNTILGILGKAGRVDEMLDLFASMKRDKIAPDIYSYNTLLHSLRKVGNIEGSLRLFEDMKRGHIRPSVYIYRSLRTSKRKKIEKHPAFETILGQFTFLEIHAIQGSNKTTLRSWFMVNVVCKESDADAVNERVNVTNTLSVYLAAINFFLVFVWLVFIFDLHYLASEPVEEVEAEPNVSDDESMDVNPFSGEKPRYSGIPEFTGKVHPDDFIDWLSTVEYVWDIPDKLKVKFVAIKLRQHASLWWDHVNKRRRIEGKSKVEIWEKMKKLMKAKFLPENYRQEAFLEYHNLSQQNIDLGFGTNFQTSFAVQNFYCQTSFAFVAFDFGVEMTDTFPKEYNFVVWNYSTLGGVFDLVSGFVNPTPGFKDGLLKRFTSSSLAIDVTPPEMRVAAEYCPGALLHNITTL